MKNEAALAYKEKVIQDMKELDSIHKKQLKSNSLLKVINNIDVRSITTSKELFSKLRKIGVLLTLQSSRINTKVSQNSKTFVDKIISYWTISNMTFEISKKDAEKLSTFDEDKLKQVYDWLSSKVNTRDDIISIGVSYGNIYWDILIMFKVKGTLDLSIKTYISDSESIFNDLYEASFFNKDGKVNLKKYGVSKVACHNDECPHISTLSVADLFVVNTKNNAKCCECRDKLGIIKHEKQLNIALNILLKLANKDKDLGDQDLLNSLFDYNTDNHLLKLSELAKIKKADKVENKSTLKKKATYSETKKNKEKVDKLIDDFDKDFDI